MIPWVPYGNKCKCGWRWGAMQKTGAEDLASAPRPVRHPVAGRAGSPRPSARPACALWMKFCTQPARPETFSHNFTPINRCFRQHLRWRTRASAYKQTRTRSGLVHERSRTPLVALVLVLWVRVIKGAGEYLVHQNRFPELQAMRAICPAHLILLALISLTNSLSAEQYKLCSSLHPAAPHPVPRSVRDQIPLPYTTTVIIVLYISVFMVPVGRQNSVHWLPAWQRHNRAHIGSKYSQQPHHIYITSCVFPSGFPTKV
jgi:hypothetical protein